MSLQKRCYGYLQGMKSPYFYTLITEVPFNKSNLLTSDCVCI